MLAVLLLNRMTTKGVAKKQKVLHPTIVNVSYNKGSENPLALCCRTCLGTENLQPLFATKDTEKKTSHDLKLVTGLNIKMDDGLSQNICKKCISLFTSALQFRRACRKAEKALLQISTTTNTDIKHNLRKKLIANAKISTTTNTDIKHNLRKKLIANANAKDNLKAEPYPEEDGNDFQNDCGYDDNGFQNESFDDVKDEGCAGEDGTEQCVDTKKPGRSRRLTIPNAPSYKCTTCHKEFKMKSTYKAHIRFHTNYCVCETCGKRCRNNHQLQEHKRARHGLGRIHKCAYCEYSSATKEALTIHERRHTGERPYVCDHCGATFHRRSNLVQHIAIHLPEKNFQCDLCPKRLKSRKFLQIHKHNAHTGRRYGYLCPICEHRFEKPNKVRVHTRRVHGLQEGEHGPIVRVQL